MWDIFGVKPNSQNRFDREGMEPRHLLVRYLTTNPAEPMLLVTRTR